MQAPYAITVQGKEGRGDTVLPFFTARGYRRECQRLQGASHVFRTVSITAHHATFRPTRTEEPTEVTGSGPRSGPPVDVVGS